MDLLGNWRDDTVEKAVNGLRRQGAEARGAVYTRRAVVEFILDLAGYKAAAPLREKRVLEPSAGLGAFAVPIVERLLASYLSRSTAESAALDLRDSLRLVEVHGDSCIQLRTRIGDLLRSHGISDSDVEPLLRSWIVEDDFLLTPFEDTFDFVFGNPPYVRQELIPDALLAEYRLRFKTIYDRADLYVPFIERSLSLLSKGGRLGFICSDRWMKNRYGLPLRRMIAEDFALEYHVDMVGTDAFHGEVSAYPAITVIARERLGTTGVAHRPMVSEDGLSALAKALQTGTADGTVHILHGAARTDAPWILDQFEELAIVRELERRFPLLEESGCKVGIGVATGADKVFIGKFDELPVEASRKEPLIMASDIRSGEVRWSGQGVVNPFGSDGRVVNLAGYPRLAEYFQKHESLIRKRNVAVRNPTAWYRTIDRIYPELTRTHKLLIPDIKGEANIVYDEGKYYPHHNLYCITSEEWPLRLLQVVLKSTLAALFIEVYSVRMRGGYLRFQAQYLRRIRLPRWSDVSMEAKSALASVDAVSSSIEAIDAAAALTYGIEEELLDQFRALQTKREKLSGAEPGRL